MEHEAPRCGTSLFAVLLGLVCFGIWLTCRICIALWRHWGTPFRTWGCQLPRTVEAVVEDFLTHRLSPEARAWLREEKTPPKWSPQAILLQNELRERYGLETWNRRLLRDCDTQIPEEAARYLLKRLWERVRGGQ
ncbi:hypothetical protein [Armatimonas sp.]|uniref:hypothetical protein n=1 Tax=Armatimonas sp. TaxID=1872638 RepID=UPI00286A4873|nr:hypothetical protein [Armatimonas sp.]